MPVSSTCTAWLLQLNLFFVGITLSQAFIAPSFPASARPCGAAPRFSPKAQCLDRRRLLLSPLVEGTRRVLTGPRGVHAVSLSGEPLGYQDLDLLLGGESIPISVWYPPEDGGSAVAGAAKYPHKISVGKITTLLTRGSLKAPEFLGPSTTLAGEAQLKKGASPQPGLPAIIFCHGYLGSRFDMLHVCEALASKGFVVAAPELPESLSAGFTPNDDTTRTAIVEATINLLNRNWKISDKVGLFGHSAGGGTSTMMPGSFSLGRVAIAGFRGYAGSDRLLVIASKGDGIIPVKGIEAALPAGCSIYREEEGAKEFISKGLGGGKSAALLFEKGIGQAPLPPNHISFLSEPTNDALVTFLSPLLPVARILDVPVLDFDKYQEARDSRETAKAFIPVVLSFFEGAK
mmetsp:Transcript_8497/g.21211  ORF Transcript_8497/g.21211 Transcript_8497/m.21211 type:complete len:403 (+) Transcript_8497:32-1240(+)